MKCMLSMGERGAQLIVELPPEWVGVGYNHPTPASVGAAIIVQYDREQLPLVKLVTQAMLIQKRDPVVAIFEDGIQIVLSVSPVDKRWEQFLQRHALLSALVGEIASFHIRSVADTFPEDPAYKVFQRCYQRDKRFSVMLMDAASVNDTRGIGLPFHIFSVGELKTEFQPLV